MSRVWYYPKGGWYDYPAFPRWRRWVPEMHEDEYGRRTLVLPVPLAGNVVFALWKCKDPECKLAREGS